MRTNHLDAKKLEEDRGRIKVSQMGCIADIKGVSRKYEMDRTSKSENCVLLSQPMHVQRIPTTCRARPAQRPCLPADLCRMSSKFVTFRYLAGRSKYGKLEDRR
jgi:hypothetical protein